ncbi:tetratricopeptide repeat protein [Winogradskyella immobilis]|uniref:tetratricopeptide repeat protein n=1 Tax=Winogradskyella immobilis TaxID=2816852 RepID=UPI001D0C06C6|nr:tetratricopeptide repeat protein [Winogradskyella immobilis]
MIFFIPVFGAIFYIITQVLTTRDVDKIQSEITTIINPTKKIKDLERKVEFSNTYANQLELADAYYGINDFNNAIINYNKTLEDTVQDSYYTRQQLVLCYFNIKDYESVLTQVEYIKNKSEFKGSKQQFCYGLALREKGDLEAAEEQLKAIDRPYSNYNERLELAKFYLGNNRKEEAHALLKEIYEESQHMTKPNRRLFKTTIIEVERLLK